MTGNVFLRSVLRQPVRAFILALIIGAAAFSFTARAVEFTVVRGAIDSAEGFYRAIGILTPTRFDNITYNHDVTEAAELIARNRRVEISDPRVFTQGVMHGVTNTVRPFHQNHFNPVLHNVSVPIMEHYFMGYMLFLPRMLPAASAPTPTLVITMRVDELHIGDRQSLRYEDQVFTNHLGQTSTVLANHLMHIPITEAESAKFNRGEWSPFGDLRAGERALFRATPNVIHNAYFSGAIWQIQPLIGDCGVSFDWHMLGDVRRFGLAINEARRSPVAELVYFARYSETDAYTAMLANLYEPLALLAQNTSSVLVTGTRDMTALPRMNDPQTARLLDSPRFPVGRWLTYEDYEENRAVAVIPAPLAIRRDIYVGDTLTITLRDNPRPNWIDTPTYSPWSRGVENWWDSRANGWWGLMDGAHTNWRDFPTHEIEVEVVGIYWFAPAASNNFTGAEIFIPASLIPDGFGWDNAPLLTGMYSFTLTSPRQEEAFLRETRAALADLGFTARILPSGFTEFAAAIDPIRTSVTVNLLVFSFVAVLAVALAIVLYLRQWRKSLAISRALGLPAVNSIKDLLRPVFYIWMPFAVMGSTIAWLFTLEQAQATLAAAGGYGLDAGEHLPAGYWLAVLCIAIMLVLLAGVGLGALQQVRRPVLEQLQGTVQTRAAYVDSGIVPNNFVLGNFQMPEAIRETTSRAARRAVFKYNLRHILRTPQKTIPSLLLAALFVFALGWRYDTILSTEAEVEYLWNTTIIHGQIIEDPEMDVVAQTGWNAVITPQVWDTMEATGFIKDAYLENLTTDGATTFFGVSNIGGFITRNTKTPIDEQLGVFCDDIYIRFLHDFTMADFDAAGGAMPVLLRAGMLDEALIPDPTDEPLAIMGAGSQLIGIFYGGLRRGVNQFGEDNAVVVIPYEDLVYMASGEFPFAGFGSTFTYYPLLLSARFTIDPARNRDLAQLREETRLMLQANAAGRIGNVPLVLILEDAVIDTVIIPLEQNLTLLRVLFPIAVAAAFLLGLGLSLLTLLQNAKNAAIMRILGKAKSATRFVLCIEQLLVCTLGVVIGLSALPAGGVVPGIIPLGLAGVYLLGAIIGTIAGAYVISAKAPLELLQVRE
ncbi:MAG: hypothetical protein FWC16_01470 [Defluviitaleaceae bacterium]|nr:hypothetical protein [Defluviitaleaceae bacterium]MCL2273574.1 hypothetical protein [Defluviitaleaceae bacterium]